MKTAIQDDRTPVQRQTHKRAVVARDKFLSGWGHARGGNSICAWALGPGVDSERVYAWVKSRPEMRNVRMVNLDTYRPSPRTAHVHIYVCEQDHIANS